MHRSRLSSVVIDCNVPDLDEEAAFWSRAIGKPVRPATEEDRDYREILTGGDELLLWVQKVDHPSRVHLDIESDDPEAEVRRLEALGAKRVAFVRRWWVMEAPTGHRFCVLRPQRTSLETDANQWPD